MRRVRSPTCNCFDAGHGGLLNPDWNVFKSNNKDYDETLYPLDHTLKGHIRDFSLFNHFVKPLAAGVTATCVIDACHSGAVLELPYSYQPTDGGTIRMQRNMTSLSNLAFLYILAGGMLPQHGLFSNVTANIEDVTGGNVEDYQGMGMDDVDAAQDGGDYGDVGNAVETGDAYGYGGDDGGVSDVGGDGPTVDGPVQGYDVVEGGEPTYGDIGEDRDIWGDGGGEFGGDWAGDGGGDADCSCLGDVLGALLDGE